MGLDLSAEFEGGNDPLEFDILSHDVIECHSGFWRAGQRCCRKRKDRT